MWAADISTDPLESDVPTELFPAEYWNNGAWRPRTWDLSPEGVQFVAIRQDEPSARTITFRVIQNWFEVLRELAPGQ